MESKKLKEKLWDLGEKLLVGMASMAFKINDVNKKAEEAKSEEKGE